MVSLSAIYCINSIVCIIYEFCQIIDVEANEQQPKVDEQQPKADEQQTKADKQPPKADKQQSIVDKQSVINVPIKKRKTRIDNQYNYPTANRSAHFTVGTSHSTTTRSSRSMVGNKRPPGGITSPKIGIQTLEHSLTGLYSKITVY